MKRFAFVAMIAFAAPARAEIDVATAVAIMFEADSVRPDVSKCTGDDVMSCLIDARFAKDKKAARVARELYTKTGSVTGLLPAQEFDGQYRGKLFLVPHLPVNGDRKHLEWLAGSLTDIDAFFREIEKHVGDGKAIKYRWNELDLRFFRSVKRRTPSAFASGWLVAYNVSGSLFTSAMRVRETMFHEIFHLNDFAHDAWSERALDDIYDAIVAKCGMKKDCLKPYAPDGIIVKGGTYYAFMPDNGVKEYGADLAKRYYIEQRAIMKGAKVDKPFKCGAPENARSWALLVDEFFGGVDLVPACR